MIVFIVGNAFFVFLDLTGKPAALLKYRVQEEKSVPVRCIIYKYVHVHVLTSIMHVLLHAMMLIPELIYMYTSTCT